MTRRSVIRVRVALRPRIFFALALWILTASIPTLLCAQTGNANGGQVPGKETNFPANAAPVLIVDQADRPLAGIQLRILGGDKESPTALTDASGTCHFPIPIRPSVYSVTLLATDATGELQSCQIWMPGNVVKPVRMVLKAAREMVIHVADQAGTPVDDGLVGVVHGTGNILAHGRTDKTGSVRLRLPADIQIDRVFALKPKIGYASTFAPDGQGNDFAPELTLKLQDVETIRLTIMDTAGKPVPGVEIRIPFLAQPITNGSRLLGRSQHYHRCPLMDQMSDEQGVATFDWIPTNMQGMSMIYVQSRDYTMEDSGKLSLAYHKGDRDLTVTVVRRTQISGRVIGEDGKPAAGILVIATGDAPYGKGYTYLRAVRTAADGTYQILVAPDKVYAVRISDNDWAAKTRLQLIVREGKPVAGLDFRLTKGTIIRGTITENEDGNPAANQTIELLENPDPPLKEQEPGMTTQPTHCLQGQTNDQGEYRFRVTQGTYTLTIPAYKPFREKSVTLSVENTPELIRDVQLELRRPRTN
jgi:uncharacterized GH25 family protein